MLRPEAETVPCISSLCFMDREPEPLWHWITCLTTTESVSHGTQNQVSRFSTVHLDWERKQKSKPPALCHHVAHRPRLQHTYLWPPSHSFCEPAECWEPACKLMLAHTCLARAGFSCWEMFV